MNKTNITVHREFISLNAIIVYIKYDSPHSDRKYIGTDIPCRACHVRSREISHVRSREISTRFSTQGEIEEPSCIGKAFVKIRVIGTRCFVQRSHFKGSGCLRVISVCDMWPNSPPPTGRPNHFSSVDATVFLLRSAGGHR